uniref:Uncharacterized protein n=1 Tax=Cacopsylla melanoneura TaxID=428564 RepID=A0A8D8RFR8_9HEMI
MKKKRKQIDKFINNKINNIKSCHGPLIIIIYNKVFLSFLNCDIPKSRKKKKRMHKIVCVHGFYTLCKYVFFPSFNFVHSYEKLQCFIELMKNNSVWILKVPQNHTIPLLRLNKNNFKMKNCSESHYIIYQFCCDTVCYLKKY